MSDFPEHDKLHVVKVQSQAIGVFLSWLQEEQSVVLSKRYKHNENCIDDGERVCGTESDLLVPVYCSISQWIAQYFDIDEAKLEAEKRSMLDDLRSGTSAV